MTPPPTILPEEEILYRFPHSHAALELLPDHKDLFRVRLCWLKGKGSRAVFESTACRPLAEVTLRGQTFPIYINQHSRKKRNQVLLAGRRKTTATSRAALRFLLYVEGRQDTFLWTWRVGATAPAMAARALTDAPDAARIRFPFLPGSHQVVMLSTGKGGRALAVWFTALIYMPT